MSVNTKATIYTSRINLTFERLLKISNETLLLSKSNACKWKDDIKQMKGPVPRAKECKSTIYTSSINLAYERLLKILNETLILSKCNACKWKDDIKRMKGPVPRVKECCPMNAMEVLLIYFIIK